MRYLLLVLLLAGCGSGGSSEAIVEPDNQSYILYGDSRCVGNKYVESRDCKGGRKLIDLDTLDSSYDLIIIHLGFNDMFVATADEWGAHLAYLIQGIENKVWCVLPTWANYHRPSEKIAAYRRVMYEVCDNITDPQIEGYQDDRIHYTDENYRQVYDYVSTIAGLGPIA